MKGPNTKISCGWSILLLVVLTACQVEPEVGTTSYYVDPIIYELEEDNASHSSGVKAKVYLMGTIHLGDKPYVFNESTEEKFQEVDVLVTETDISDSSGSLAALVELATENTLDKTSATEHERNLESLVNYYAERKGYSDNLYAECLGGTLESELNTLVSTGGATTIRSVEPALADNIILLTMFSGGTAVSPYVLENGVDNAFLTKAAESGKSQEYLASSEEQLGTFFSIDVDEQAMSLVETLAALCNLDDRYFHDIAELIQAYVRQDVNTIKEIMRITDESDSSFLYLITFRNRAWVSSLKNIIASREVGDKATYFVVVGMAHLVTIDGYHRRGRRGYA